LTTHATPRHATPRHAPRILQNEVDSIRLRTAEYEMIIAQHGNFTIIVTQDRDPNSGKVQAGGAEGEKKEGEGEKKAAE